MLALSRGLLFADRYRLIDRLGAGGMSEVWSGLDQVLGRLVAVKVLSASLADAQWRDLLRREARAMAQLSQSNVVNVHDYGEISVDGAVVPFVVMELLHGQTLAHVLAAGPLPWPQATSVAAQVAAALSAAHGQGLIHCDVTPSNVMLTNSGVKVLDFGIALLAGAHDTDGRRSFGTPGYLAPERMTSEAPLTPAADVYALGVLLWAALTGLDPGLLAAQSMRAQLASISGLPDSVIDLCMRCLAAQASDRPGSGEVARVLAAVPGVHLGPIPQANGPKGLPRTLALPTVATDSVATVWPARRLIAAAAGLLLLAVAAFVLATGLLSAGHLGRQTARPVTSPSPTAVAPTTSPQPAPSQATTGARGVSSAVANLRQLVVNGQAAGEIRAQCAESLLSRIADLQRRIDRGDSDDARHRIEQIGEEIDDRAAGGDVTAQRATTLRQALAAVVV